MRHQDLLNFLEHSGKDPSRLIFEDELTGIYNRRFLYQYLQSKVPWDALEDNPLSLIMLDVDNFKAINDRFGHGIGDQALIWVAGLLKEVAGEDGLAIRYAGDEFMLLLLKKDKEASIKRGSALHKKVHRESFQPSISASPLKITLSIGIASAPEDAKNTKGLIQKADTALYSAKKKGRNCFVNASEVALEEVFDKTAIYQLEDVRIVGRGPQISEVAKALTQFNRKKSQFLIVTGPAGIGKTEFLEGIRANMPHKNVWVVRASGTPQEMYRPYYLMTSILLEILKQREDRGAKVLDSLSQTELAYLAQIIPQFGVNGKALEKVDESRLREGIFTALVQFIPKILDHRPLVLFIDDMHFGDEATMLLLRRLILKGEVQVFVCATSLEGAKAEGVEEKNFIQKFYGAYHQELGMRKILLTPLTAKHIAKHLNRIFPNALKPQNFEEDLAQVTQGNPLFISEILRNLVLDQKITLVGNQWVIRPVEQGHLPKSLDEMVKKKISALDEDNRHMLEQVSALGDDVSLSMLTGSSEAMETKVLDFVDQAAAQGLIHSDFQLNDEVIRFSGKRVHDISYSGIEPKRKEELHQQIANYQEKLYNRQLLPSEAPLAYHFKRSTNKEKAGTYEKRLAASNKRRFSAQEAVLYDAEAPLKAPEEDVPLDREGMALVPKLIRDFMVAVRNIRLYPRGSKSITTVTKQLKTAIDEILETNERLNIMQVERAMVANGQKVGTKEFKMVAKSFLDLLNQLQLKGIAFRPGLPEREVEVMLEAFGRTEQKTFDDHHWERLMVENEMEHIELKQIRYTRSGTTGVFSLDEMSVTDVLDETSSEFAGKLSQPELRLLAEILRSFLGVLRTVKLYPLESKTASIALEKLTKFLRAFIKNRGLLTLSRAGEALLVNGEKVVSTEFKGSADKFHKYLVTIGLSSITFLRRFRDEELVAFIGALGDLPDRVVESDFWKGFAKEQGLSGILFDRHLYEVRVAETLVPSGTADLLLKTPKPRPQPQLESGPLEPFESLELESFESFLQDFPDRMKESLLNKEEEEIKKVVQKLFSRFHEQEVPVRGAAIRTCRRLLEELPPAFRHDFVKLLSGPLLSAFAKEKNLNLTVEMAAFLSNMVSVPIDFVDYRTAARILSHLQRRQQELAEAGDPKAKLLAKSLEGKLEPSTEKMLLADLKSGDTSRLRDAAQLLAALGQVAGPFLIEIIKQEDDYRPRKVAALLLKRQGAAVTERLKSLLVLEVTPEERARILDVIDTLSSNLNRELTHALGDHNSQVRQAAFRLAERLNNKRTIELLLDLAKSQNRNLAISAIRCLGKLSPPNADKTLIRLLNSSKEDEFSVVCCRALGQIATPAAIDPLSKLLPSKGFFPFRKKRSEQLRAAAAFALGQISHPRVSEVLAPFIEDKDPRIREIARSVVSPV